MDNGKGLLSDRSAITVGAEMESRKEMLVVLKLHILDVFDEIKVFKILKLRPP